MERKMFFKNKVTGREVVLPVTPSAYQISEGQGVQTVSLHQVGEIHLAGPPKRSAFEIDCFFPSNAYPFNQPGTVLDPFYYVAFFQSAIVKREILVFSIPNTPIRLDVLVGEITYSEEDGTNDVQCRLNLYPAPVFAATATGGAKTATVVRMSATPPVASQNYIIKRGDTLSAICRKFYGNANLYPKLARFNKIPNPNLIYTGNTLKIPPIGGL